jgi:hypothetical protein
VRGQLSEQFEDVVYSYGLVSGQQVFETSGAVKLHSIIVNRGTSGQFYTIYDSAVSGRFLSAGAVVVAVCYCGSGIDNPKAVDYNIRLNSGLVIVASGSTWNISATYK